MCRSLISVRNPESRSSKFRNMRREQIASAPAESMRSRMLDVPVSFFFEGLASNGAKLKSGQYDLAQQLLATRDGIELTKAFMSIDDRSLRRSIVTMVEEIANREAAAAFTCDS